MTAEEIIVCIFKKFEVGSVRVNLKEKNLFQGINLKIYFNKINIYDCILKSFKYRIF